MNTKRVIGVIVVMLLVLLTGGPSIQPTPAAAMSVDSLIGAGVGVAIQQKAAQGACKWQQVCSWVRVNEAWQMKCWHVCR